MPSASHSPDAGSATVSFTIKGDDFELGARVNVPAGLVRTADLLPLAQGISDRMVAETVVAVERMGSRISCRKGCAACCSNLVAISEVEARRIAEVVSAMPEPRQSEIRMRFATARERFDAAGLLEVLQRSSDWTDEEYKRLVGDYFRERVPCPFLEAGSCSIYEDRPITCREFLVVSPPEHCAKDDSSELVRVRMLMPVFHAVAQWQTTPAKHLMERVVPLILAPEWADEHPDSAPSLTGPELLQELVHLLSVKPKT